MIGKKKNSEHFLNDQLKLTGKQIGLWSLMLCLVCLPAVSGCSLSSSEQETEETILYEQEKEITQYTLTPVSRGTVSKTEKIVCNYEKQGETQSYSFPVSGRKVDAVYVQNGDIVSEGQVLARLAGSDYTEEIMDLTYQLKRLEIRMKEIREYEYLREQEIRGYYGNQNTNQANKEVAAVYESWRHSYEDLEDSYAIAAASLAEYEKARDEGLIVSRIEGEVTFIAEDLKGSISEKDKTVISVTTLSECLFSSKQTEYASYFQKGKPVWLSILKGSCAGEYRVYPYQTEEWGDRLLFSLQDDTVDPEPNTTGNIRITLESAENVLTLPKSAIHQADSRAYVYVIRESGLRSAVWIETGLYGDDSVEIFSGLEEGDMVILK